MERRAEENKVLREMVDAFNEFVAVRDEFWSLGLLDKLLRPDRCAAVLTRYETARTRIRAAIRQAKEAARVNIPHNRPGNGAADAPDMERASASWSRGVISAEELEMLLGKSSIPKKYFSG